MRRIRLISIFLLAIFLFTGCGNVAGGVETTNPEPIVSGPMPGFDAQNKYANFNVVSFQETDNFFCGSTLLGDQLYYYDKETGISGILCADPACSHDGSSCGAFVKNGATMFLYDGLRYWITNDIADGTDYILWQGDISGANQKKVKTISFENIILQFQPQQYAIHRGNFYFLGTADTVSGVSTGTRLTLMGSPLDDSKGFATLFDQTYNTYVNPSVRYVGNYAFLLVQTWTEAGSVDLTIYKIDLNSGETEIVYEEMGGTSCDGFWVTEQGDVYLANLCSVCKIENGALVSVATFEHTDGVANLMDGIAVSTYLEDNLRCIEIIDFAGNTLYDGPMFTADIPGLDGDPNQYRIYSMLIVGGDTDKLIIGLSSFESNSMEYYAILLDLRNNLAPTLLWKTQ